MPAPAAQQVCAAVQATEPRATVTCTISPQYRNMRYWLEKDMRPGAKSEIGLRARMSVRETLDRLAAADAPRHVVRLEPPPA